MSKCLENIQIGSSQKDKMDFVIDEKWILENKDVCPDFCSWISDLMNVSCAKSITFGDEFKVEFIN